MKKVTFGNKPRSKSAEIDADRWVENRGSDIPPPPANLREPMKRLTIDVPVSLHKRIKSQCAAADVMMADEIRDLLEQRFVEPTKQEVLS